LAQRVAAPEGHSATPPLAWPQVAFNAVLRQYSRGAQFVSGLARPSPVRMAMWTFWKLLLRGVFFAGCGSAFLVDLAHASLLRNEAAGYVPNTYTRNAVCLTRFCINPLFPAMSYFGQSVLGSNEQLQWDCPANPQAWKLAGFCSRVVSAYPFALPQQGGPQASATAGQEDQEGISQVINVQVGKAMSAYVAHLSGMGHDFWDHLEPWDEDECIQSVWRMSCLTYFPRCNKIEPGKYLRPCATSCGNYLRACRVSCCDESASCLFTHAKEMPDGTTVYEEGYVDHAGPSPFCTGAATPTHGKAPVLLGLLCTLVGGTVSTVLRV